MTKDSHSSAFANAIAAATSDHWSEEEYWHAVVALRESGATAASLSSLTTADDPRLRAIVPDVLRVPPNKEEAAQVTDHLRAMLRREEAPRVLESIVAALNELAPSDLVALVLPLVANASADVRHAVAVALGGSRDERAIAALISLSNDSDARVRNWAVFGLGSQLENAGVALVDNEKLRDALAARLTDPHEETRAEAALGLALRRDSRAIPIVIREIEQGTPWCQYVEAAYHLASPALCPVLRKFLESMDESGRTFWENQPKFPLSLAIKACCGDLAV